jgi:hypothetical protein
MDEKITIPVRNLGELPLHFQEQCDEALSELERELQVRERCFPRWVAEGRVSRIDARDRLDRQKKAVIILRALLDNYPPPDDIAGA